MLRGIRSNDLIPLGYIRLSEAFERYYQAVTPSWHELNAAIDAANPPEGEINAAASRKLDTARGEAFNARDIARGEADKKFREAIAAGKLQPMNRDPVTGDLLKLSQNGWDRPTNSFPGGFDDDFVESGDPFQPGPPDAPVRGKLRPVFFDQKEFEGLLATLTIEAEGNRQEQHSSELKPCHDRVEPVQIARWPIPEKEPRGPKQAAAWRLAKRVWGDDGGPMKGPSWREITETLNNRRIDGEALVGEDTVKRMFFGE